MQDKGRLLPATDRADAVQAAREAGLRYRTDAQPGIRRKRRGKGFLYLDSAGRALHGERQLTKKDPAERRG